jgi:predicted PhzF superfamily epimerase YddE/YHI9
MTMNILRIAAFSDAGLGGNPAGVMIADTLPDAAEMQRIAAEVGYSETAFAMPEGNAWRVRYFSPESEVPFCGHATIALGAALQSPQTHSATMSAALLTEVLALFGYRENDLNAEIPPARVHGGADHLAVCLNSRAALSAMQYDLAAGRELMKREGVITILLAYAETPRLFHTRNPFASGGVYEDPATGAATAAFAGYLRDIEWPHQGSIEIIQGEDMGMRSRLRAEITDEPGSSIRVSGSARIIEDSAA